MKENGKDGGIKDSGKDCGIKDCGIDGGIKNGEMKVGETDCGPESVPGG